MLRNCISALLVDLAAQPALAGGDVERGKALVKSWQCSVCHGLTGNDRSAKEFPVPMLAGQPEEFIVRRLSCTRLCRARTTKCGSA